MQAQLGLVLRLLLMVAGDGQPFALRLPEPVTALELRVVGTPACGDRPAQAFSSCAELGAR